MRKVILVHGIGGILHSLVYSSIVIFLSQAVNTNEDTLGLST